MSDISTTPTWELNHFCLWVARATEAYFKDPDVQRRYNEWMKEKEREANKGASTL